MDKQEFSGPELLLGYKEVILYYEKKLLKEKTGFNRKRLNNYLKIKKIDLSSKGVAGSNDFRNKNVSFFHFKKDNKLSEIVSLFKHLRNCFAHGNVEKINIEGKPYYCFEDKYTSGKRKGQQSMIGQIPQKDFKGFLQELKENQKYKSNTKNNG